VSQQARDPADVRLTIELEWKLLRSDDGPQHLSAMPWATG
jgi:hypothetical protein